MHSKGTMIHLQHMIDRACNGNHGEEKEIASILFDDVYTFVEPVYNENEAASKVTRAIIKKYISKLEGRTVIDVRSDIHMYAASSMYKTLKRDSQTILLEDNLEDAYVCSVLSADEESYDVLISYNQVFESKRAYDSTPDMFKEMPKGLIILMELYVYEGCSVSHIAELLDEDEKLIESNIGLLKRIIENIGMCEYDDTFEEDSDIEKSHTGKSHSRKNDIKKHKKNSLHEPEDEYDTQDEEDESGIIDILFPKLTKKMRILIDIVAAAVIFIIGMIILRF